jgi:hypothetical protein
MFYTTVVVRRGQKGKWRVEQNMLLAPIFKLPGVPLDFTVPPSDERKHFVDMQPNPLETMDLRNCGGFSSEGAYDACMYNYLGYALSKGLFLKELDSATKPIDHPLMKKLEVNGDKPRQRVFSSNKKSSLRTLVSDVEALVNDRHHDHISELFWSPIAQERVFNDIRNFEVALTLPSLEYGRKVNSVLKSAINYISDKLRNSKEGRELPNHRALVESAKMTTKAVNDADSRFAAQISRRLNHIVKNRELVKSEVPFPMPSPSFSKGKVTHVFSSNQN